jgi:hypothetical protein
MDFSCIINDICCDDRLKDGIPDLNNLDFCFLLQEYLVNKGIPIEEVVEKTSILFEKGNFPDRQAYNKNGILVTFPNKEYRDRAVNKGTHSIENPKKQDPNIFTDKDKDSLSISDIDIEKKDGDPADENLTLDDYIEDEINDINLDLRTKQEKELDSVGVVSILDDDPLSSEDILDLDEVINNYERYGMYGSGKNWYNSDGKLVGEQYYDESSGKCVIKILKESSAAKLESSIVSNLNGFDYEDERWDKIGKSTSKYLIQKLKKIKNTSELGSGTVETTDFWKSFGATDKTPKTDIIVNDLKCSVKYGPSQLMSGKSSESVATFMSATKKIDLEESITSECLELFNNFVDSSKTIKGNIGDLLSVDREQIKDELELKVKDLVDSANSSHKSIMSYLNSVFNNNDSFKYEFIKEAMTGNFKFGKDSEGSADTILSVSKKTNDVFLSSINKNVIEAVQNKTRLSVRFKSSSFKRKDTGEKAYRFWSVLGLLTSEYKSKIQEINELLEDKEILEENLLNKLKELFLNLKLFISNLYNRIISYIKKSINNLFKFFEIYPDVTVNDGEDTLDFSSILNDFKKV